MALIPETELEQMRPSSLYRQLKCAGSRRLAAKAPPKPSSRYADEGTAAHSLGEQCLRYNRAPFEFRGQRINVNGKDWLVTDNMVIAVGKYVSHVWKRMQALPGAALHLERKLWVSEINNGGMVDCLLIAPQQRRLEVHDYKHGEGVYVTEVMNEQFLAYTMGALDELWPRYPGEDVPKDIDIAMVVHQPRFPDVKPVRRYEITSGDLMDWRTRHLFPAIQATRHDNAPLVAGDHCQFCPAKPICVAYLSAPKTPYQRVPIKASAVPTNFQF